MKKSTIALLNQGEGRELLKKRCREAGISITTVEELVRVELEHVGKKKRHGLWPRIDEILDEAVCEADQDQPPVNNPQRGLFDVHSQHPAP